MIRTAAALALVTALSAPAAAQQVPDAPLTLSTAVELAIRNHPAIRVARAGSAAASEEIAVARTAYLPRLDLLWQANRATRNNVFGLLLPQSVIPAVSGPVLPTETLDGVWSSAGGLLFSWEAVDFGRRSAAVDLARAESGAADAQRRVTELEIATGAADAFLSVLAAEAILDAARANVQRLEVFANNVRALVENQLRAGVERSRADAEVAAARNRLIEAQRDVELARVSLAEAVGAPGAPVTVARDAALTVPLPPANVPFDAAVHPRAVAADADIDAVSARDRVLDASYLPRVELQSAFAGRGVSRQIDGTSNGNALGWQAPNWAIGLSVTFPSLEIFRTQARRRVEANRLQEAMAHYDHTVQALQTQDARARAVTASAFQFAANTPQQLQAARDTDAQARARYDAGLTSIVEVAEAQRLLAQAEAENAVANLAVWRALMAAAVVRGDLQLFLKQIGATDPPTVP